MAIKTSKFERPLSNGILDAVIAFSLWGVLPVYWGSFKGISPIYLVCYRIIFSAIFLGVYRYLWVLNPSVVNLKSIVPIVISSALLSVNWGIYVYAVSTSEVLASALGYFISPLILIGLGAGVYRETLTPSKRLSLIFLAFAVIPLSSVAKISTVFIALGLAISISLYGLIKKSTGMPATEALSLESLALAPIAALFILSSPPDYGSALDLFHLLSTGPVTILPLIFFARATKRGSLIQLGYAQYLNPTLQFLCGILIFGEELTWQMTTSFFLIWTGVLISFPQVGIVLSVIHKFMAYHLRKFKPRHT